MVTTKCLKFLKLIYLKEREISHPLVYSADASQARLGQIQESGTESGFPRWVAGTHTLEPSPVSQGERQQEARIRSGARTETQALRYGM